VSRLGPLGAAHGKGHEVRASSASCITSVADALQKCLGRPYHPGQERLAVDAIVEAPALDAEPYADLLLLLTAGACGLAC